MKELIVDLGQRSYPVLIGRGLLKSSGNLISSVIKKGKVLLISNPTVFPLYGPEVVASLKEAGYEVIVGLMPDGERFKNIEEAMKILDLGVKAGLQRDSVVVALGGGVTGDLAGLVAALYMRGINFIQIPTTLLAQVDSSIGGKVGVNHHLGKNLIGAFHQPLLVISDTDTLATLEKREYYAGLGEAVKYGIIYNKEFFTWMENNWEGIVAQNDDCLQEIIYQSCLCKAGIVKQDEKETGIRAILNLGHTFGHSLEKLTDYTSYRHGEAVVLGIIAAGYLACYQGYLQEQERKRIENILHNLGLIYPFPAIDSEKIYMGMLNDKKVQEGNLRLIVPRGIGNAEIIANVARETVIKAIEAAREITNTKGI
ncbi:MAG: 3-dehydroquinate synthase [Syntrophomonadaceae bacterium]|jgi:3-dehydroquinate synthase